MEFYKSRSTQYPILLDFESSPTTVWIRKNVVEIEIENELGDGTHIEYEYDETKILKTEYIKILNDKLEQTEEALQELIIAFYSER